MKPKERKPQHQTSRLYLRKKDHREVIFNDTYHNAIWMKKEQDGEQKDELVWMKYPNRYFMYRTRFYSGTSADVFGYFDIDRQFSFGTSMSRSMTAKILNLQNYIVVTKTYSTTTVSVSKDGLLFKSKNYTSNMQNMFRFSDDSMVAMWQSGSTLSYRILDIKNFDADDFNILETNITSETVSSSSIPSYVCETDRGCIVIYRSNNSAVFYELTRSGVVRLNPVALPNVHNTTSGFGGKNIDFYCFCNCEIWRESVNPFKYDYCVYYSNDKINWNKVILFSKENSSSANGYGAMTCVTRGLYTYFYCRYDDEIRLFKTMTGEVFQEVELPKTIIVSAINDAGMGVGNSGFNTIQIKLKKDAASSADFSFTANEIDFASMQNGWGETYFEDGKLEPHTEFLSFQIVHQNGSSSRNYYQVALNNNEFQSSEDNVFFSYNAWSEPSGNNYADKILNGDYVL